MTAGRRVQWRAAVATIVVLLLLAPPSRGATRPFKPDMRVLSDTVVANHPAGLTVDVTQADGTIPVRSYEVAVPAGWRISLASIDPSPLTSCRMAVADNRTTMEVLGSAMVKLHTDMTRMTSPGSRQSGPAVFRGGIWFLSWDPSGRVATMCADVRTNNSQIASANREIMIEISAVVLGDGSIRLTYDLDAVPGALPGERSITDNPTYLAQNVSVLETELKLSQNSGGNYNQDPSGKHVGVTLVQTPLAQGRYVFAAMLSACSAGAPNCDAAPVSRQQVVYVTGLPQGVHPAPVVNGPAYFGVVRGPSATVKWYQPAVSEQVAGYVMLIGVPYLPNAVHHERIETTCTADCSRTLTFPLSNLDSSLPDLPVEGVFRLRLITRFADGHRSDGRCDDGSILGAPAPCADGTTPAFKAPGYGATEFLHRTEAWPLAFEQIVAGSNRRTVGQIYVLLANLDEQRFEFVFWKPIPANYDGGGSGVMGSNTSGGVITYEQLSGPRPHWGLHMTITGSRAGGYFETWGSTRVPQTTYSAQAPSSVIQFLGGVAPQ
jgi:hypothetical protein